MSTGSGDQRYETLDTADGRRVGCKQKLEHTPH